MGCIREIQDFYSLMDKGVKSVNCSNYPNLIRKAAFYPRKKFPLLTVVYVIKDTKKFKPDFSIMCG